MTTPAPVALRLTDKQAIFVKECSRGVPPGVAATIAGYSSPEQTAYNLKSNPMVQAAIASELRKFLHIEAAPAAIKTMYEFMVDTKRDDKLRLACAKTLADRAGYVPPKAKDNSGLDGKSVTEMSADEMKDMAAKIQRELAERATPIIDNAPQPDTEEGQAFDPLG